MTNYTIIFEKFPPSLIHFVHGLLKFLAIICRTAALCALKKFMRTKGIFNLEIFTMNEFKTICVSLQNGNERRKCWGRRRSKRRKGELPVKFIQYRLSKSSISILRAVSTNYHNECFVEEPRSLNHAGP